ncbi:MAG: rhodanese-like domain-containing protein [Candidatus Sulfomarinibacteraceae bacterium]
MQHITPRELRSKLDREGQELLLLDARGDETYAEEHIPHAKSAPETALRERVDGLVDRETEIVVYCNNEDCSLSKKTARGLEELGYTNVVRVPAGIDGWKNAGFDTVSN